MKQKKQFGPKNLRAILSVLLTLIIIGGGFLFYKGLGIVEEYAVKVDQRLADASASERQLSELQTLKSQISQSNSLIDKANQVFASPATYQGQVLNDLKNYADAAGLSLANTSFSNPDETGSHSVTVTFGGAVSYQKLLTFLGNIEGNLPKLQVSSISLARPSNATSDSVRVDDIKINISVR